MHSFLLSTYDRDTEKAFTKARFPNLRKLVLYRSQSGLLSSLLPLRHLQTLKINNKNLALSSPSSFQLTLTKVTLVGANLFAELMRVLGSLTSSEAPTWLEGCRTGVWRGPTRPDAGYSIRCGYQRVSAASELFFFFFLGFAPTWLNLRRLDFDSTRVGPYQPATETAETGWNWLWIMPKQPKSALNEAQTSQISPSSILFWIFVASFVFSFLFCVSCLHLSLFYESRP